MPAPSKRDKFSIGNLQYLAPVAMTIARAGILVPSSTSTSQGLWSQVSPGSRCEQHLRSEFLRLGVGPTSQFVSGNSGWKSKIVLNPRTGTRLPSGRVGFYHQDVKALRSAIHG